MKIKPTIYAQSLIASVSNGVISTSRPLSSVISTSRSDEKSHDRKPDIVTIAKNFWHLLQKNKQYKDLGKILEELEIEAARAEGKVIAKVYSGVALSESELAEINDKLIKKYPDSRRAEPNPLGGARFQIQNSVKSATTGVIVKVGDKIIDLSVENKINRLKNIISK